MFRMRCGNCCTKRGESRRIYPARQTRSTQCCCREVTTARSCSSRGTPFDGTTRAVRPSCLAVRMPPASGLFEMTTAMRAPGIFPAAMFPAMASKFEPRPESRMPRFFIEELAIGSCLRVHHLPLTLHDAPHVVILLPDALQQCLGLLEFLRIDHQ